MAKSSITSNINDSWFGPHLFGHRYIFFKSLQETHPSLYQAVLTHYDRVDNQFFNTSKEKNKDNESLKYMKQYLEMLKTLIQREQAVELKYVNKLMTELNANKYKNSELGQELIACINTNKSIDYIKLTTLLNLLKQNTPLFKQELEVQIKNIKEMLNSLDEAPPELNQKILQAYSERYKEYKSLITQQLTQTHDNKKVEEILEQTYSQKIQIRIDDIMKRIQTPELLNTIVTFYTQQNMSRAQQEQAIKRLVILMALKNINIFQLTSSDLQQLLPNLMATPLHSLNLEDIFQNDAKLKQDLTTIEEQAIRSGVGLAEKFLQITDPRQQTQLLRTYGIEANPEKNRKLRNFFETYGQHSRHAGQYKRQFTIQLREAIYATRDAWVKSQAGLTKKSLQEQNDAWLQHISTSKNTISYDSLAKCLQISVIKNSDMGEIMSTPEAQVALEEMTVAALQHKTYLPARRILKKNDTMITWTWDTDKMAQLFTHVKHKGRRDQAQQVTARLLKELDAAQAKFLSNYNKRAQDTSPDAAWQTYRNEMYKISQEYLKLYKNLEQNDVKDAEQLTDFLNNTFFESISVKDYEFYHPTAGFKAGSLGGSGRVVQAIPNILRMYQLGGIDTIDQELIIEALLNYSDNLISPPASLFEHLESYLLGGAALLLFDDGFANMETFLKAMQEFFQNTTGPQQVHLLYLNNTYYFCSFILQQIYNNLTNVFQDIIETVETKPENIVTSYHLTINNSLRQPAEQTWYTLGLTTNAERWNWMSKTAEEQVTISFLFLGGLLDILQQIQVAAKEVG